MLSYLQENGKKEERFKKNLQMINFFNKDKRALRKAKKTLQDEERPYYESLAKAEKDGKSRKEIDIILCEMQGVCAESRYELEVLESRQLVKRAEKLQLPVPAYNNDEMWKRVFNYRFLTENGKLHLIKLIRTEKREKTDIFVKKASVIIGIIGSLSALISVINK